ncbi:MAG TPA: alpha/beta hydrolase [Kofleriaceae bacterium]|nr:alpha/beta hydrolase [Kofleriaceae bacterium]
MDLTGSLQPVRRGDAGPRLVFVHGSAADHTTWSVQLAILARTAQVIAYDRRGTGASAALGPDGGRGLRVEDHAGDLAHLIESLSGPRPIACGSSFGAVIVLELARTRPELIAGLVLCEPPMAASDDLPAVPAAFGCAFDRVAALRGGPAAGAMFLRSVLGDQAFAAMPTRWRERACGLWQQIRADSVALARYRPRYRELRELRVPALLVGGARSAGFYAPTLEALQSVLPDSELHILAGAGHMMHAEQARSFNALAMTFAARVSVF